MAASAHVMWGATCFSVVWCERALLWICGGYWVWHECVLCGGAFVTCGGVVGVVSIDVVGVPIIVVWAVDAIVVCVVSGHDFEFCLGGVDGWDWLWDVLWWLRWYLMGEWEDVLFVLLFVWGDSSECKMIWPSVDVMWPVMVMWGKLVGVLCKHWRRWGWWRWWYDYDANMRWEKGNDATQ